LQPLSPGQLQVFMQIEQPEFPPIGLAAAAPATIGAFYDTISTAFTAIKPAINPNAHFLKLAAQIGQIKTTDDALAAIARIKTEGEGTHQSRDQPAIDGKQLAHYYIFKQISKGKQFIKVDDKWDYVGPAIQFPNVFNFVQSPANPALPAFEQQLALLLSNLQACWTSGTLPDLAGMTQLQQLGTDLIQNGIRPEFVSNRNPGRLQIGTGGRIPNGMHGRLRRYSHARCG
jgi:Ferritin-like